MLAMDFIEPLVSADSFRFKALVRLLQPLQFLINSLKFL